MAHPIDASFLSGEAIGAVARAAEVAGFESVWLTEHPAPPDRWLDGGGHDSLDPFVALSFAAAATTKLRLLTNLTVLPYRNPFLLTKAVATLDRLSGGRVTLGVGTGYLKGEYRALGVDFDDRNTLFDQSLQVMRAAWTGESVVASNPGFSTKGSTTLPTPVQSPLPIWIGGNSKLTRRRVAAGAQGWMPMWNPAAHSAVTRTAPLESLADLRDLITALRADARDAGRMDHIDMAITPHSSGPGSGGDLAAIMELAEAGVDVAVINLSPPGPDEDAAADAAVRGGSPDGDAAADTAVRGGSPDGDAVADTGGASSVAGAPLDERIQIFVSTIEKYGRDVIARMPKQAVRGPNSSIATASVVAASVATASVVAASVATASATPGGPAGGGLGRFLAAAELLGVEVAPVKYPQGTRTAVDAASAIGCDVSQIAKSLVLAAGDSVVLALTAGHHRVDLDKLSAIVGERVRMANADQVRSVTGYAIGGTPPFGHANSMPVYIDSSLLDHSTIYGAAGTPDTCFPITPERLVQVTGAVAADFLID